MRLPYHPETDQIRLTEVFDALSDETRLGIVRRLAECGEAPCGDFGAFGTKSNLTYHLARLREAGVTQVRQEGTARIVSLRAEDLDCRFPGLLTAILGAKRD
jgi:DNA-binding transcriptional ArsR family regulator